jgi:hypothetical protein
MQHIGLSRLTSSNPLKLQELASALKAQTVGVARAVSERNRGTRGSAD